MNELRISRHSNMVIGTKQIFKREKIEAEEEEAWWVTISKRKKIILIINREELGSCGFQDKLHSKYLFWIIYTKNMLNLWFILIMSRSYSFNSVLVLSKKKIGV